MKPLLLKLHNKFHNLVINDVVDTVDTECITLPISGASPSEHGTKAKPKVCLIPCVNYFVTIQITRKFIKKLSKHVVPKKYFVQTLQPKAKLMVKVGLKSVDMHQMINVDALLDNCYRSIYG